MECASDVMGEFNPKQSSVVHAALYSKSEHHHEVDEACQETNTTQGKAKHCINFVTRCVLN